MTRALFSRFSAADRESSPRDHSCRNRSVDNRSGGERRAMATLLPGDVAALRSQSTLRPAVLIYSGVALGLLAGAAISTWVWRQRVRASDLLNVTPLERAEQLIAACESKLESIESSFSDLKSEHAEKT